MRLFRIAALAAVCFCAMPVQAQEFWGAELPGFGASPRITGLYRSREGAVVMGFIAGPRNARFVDFYDVAQNKRLAPERAREVARDNAVRERVLADLRLTPIPSPALGMANSAGTVFTPQDLSGGRCRWPYDTALTIAQPGPSGPVRNYMVAWKLPRPQTGSYGCGYRDVGEQRQVRTRYQAEYPSLYWSSGPDVYAVFGDRFLVRFDAKGNTRFFDGRTDVVMVPAEKIAELLEPLASWAENGVVSTRQAQAFVSQTETIIADAARTIPAR